MHKYLLFFRKMNKNSLLFELLTHGKNYLSASILSRVFTLITIPLLTYHLSVEEFGILSLFTACSAVFTILFGLGIRGSVGLYYAEKNSDFSYFLGNSLLITMVSSALGFCVIYLFIDPLEALINIPQNIVLLSALIALLTTSVDVYLSFLQASQKSKQHSILTVLKSILLCFLIVAALYAWPNSQILGVLYANITVAGVIFGIAVFKLKNKMHINVSLEHSKYALCIGLPIMVHLLSGYVLNSFDQIMINKMIGTYEAGLYAFVYKVGTIFQLYITSLSQAWSPILYKNLKAKKYLEINQTIQKNLIISSLIAIGIAILAPLIITVLAPVEYFKTLSALPPIIMGIYMFYIYSIHVGYSFYSKKTIIIAMGTIAAGVLNIALNAIFIPQFGYHAAAWTTFISFALLACFHVFVANVFLKNMSPIKIKYLAIPICMTVISLAFSYWFYSSYINMKNLVVAQLFHGVSIFLIFLIYFIKNKKNEHLFA